MRRTHYCGAYWGWGFHEDGVQSAQRSASLRGGAVSELYEGWVRHRRFAEPAARSATALYMTLSKGTVRRLELPSSLGVGFNPVRFHYEMDGDRVRSIAAEVTNTPWGERRTYRFEGRGGHAAKECTSRPSSRWTTTTCSTPVRRASS